MYKIDRNYYKGILTLAKIFNPFRLWYTYYIIDDTVTQRKYLYALGAENRLMFSMVFDPTLDLESVTIYSTEVVINTDNGKVKFEKRENGPVVINRRVSCYYELCI